ncbi:hypothetical protein D3C86_1869340 [compost metagenome]
MQDAANIDVNHLIPFADFQCLEFRQRHHPGVIDHHIDPAMQVQGKIDKPLNIGSPGDIQCLEMGASPPGVDLGAKYFETLRTTCAEHDMRALAG